MITTTDNRTLRYLGGRIGAGDAHIHGPVDGYWIVIADGVTHRVPAHLRDWRRYANRGKPPGRRRAQEPSGQLSLTLPMSTINRIPTPRQAHIKRWIDNGLMAHEMTEYLTGGA